jgi:hypothetical protein
MGLRVFRDHDGTQWKVWDVRPYVTRDERRARERRLAAESRPVGIPERRTGHDRRRRDPTLFTPGLEAGWLCFENRQEKRRLTPIPPGWQQAAEPELEDLLEHARRVARRLGPADEPGPD